MRRLLSYVAILPSAALVAIALSAARPIDQPTKPGDSPAGSGQPTRRALLVGVTKYPNLAPHFQLEEPADDVVLMKATLVERFQVPPENITTLSEVEGEKNADRLPTRTNIEREFKRLAELTRPGDEVIILLGGHGSQQPEKPNAKEPEIDGLDEIFLPRDVGKWDGKGSVENAIIDDELGEWITAIWEKNK